MLAKAQKLSETIVGDMDFMQNHLEKCYAFKEPTEAKLIIPDKIT